MVGFQWGRRLSRSPGVGIDGWESGMRRGGWASGRRGGRVMNWWGWEIILPRDSVSPMTGIIQGKKNLQRKQWICNYSVFQKWNVSWSGIHYNISVLHVIVDQFFSRKICYLIINLCCFFVSYCVEMKDFSFIGSHFLSFWSVYPKRMVIDGDVDLSTDYVSAIVSR